MPKPENAMAMYSMVHEIAHVIASTSFATNGCFLNVYQRSQQENSSHGRKIATNWRAHRRDGSARLHVLGQPHNTVFKAPGVEIKKN